MEYYRNIGAPFNRDNGARVQSGEVFVPTQRELNRRRNKLRRVDPAGEDIRPPEPAPPPPAGWPLRMSPETYLRLTPDGPHAELARALAGPEPVEPVQHDPEWTSDADE